MILHRFDLSSNNRVEVGFGEVDDTLKSVREHLSAAHKIVPLLSLHQIHSNIAVERLSDDGREPEADAHWSEESSVGLAIKTADCLPVFGCIPGLSVAQKTVVIAIHAGWRGVASDVIGQTLRQIESSQTQKGIGSSWSKRLSASRFWIGPHIRKESFIIKQDAVQPLLSAVPTEVPHNELVEQVDHEHFKFDLLKLATLQLRKLGIEPNQVDTSSAADSFSDARFHSHRRDRSKAGRNISWISLSSSD